MKDRKAAIFLDRDGTINVDYGYVYQKDKLQFIDGVVEGLQILQKAGYLLIIVTNQSGIARGYFTEDELKEFHDFLLSQLEKKGITISKIYYCPHLEGCNCRKPKLGLFYKAQQEFGIDFKSSYVIGDKLRDLSLCEKENVKGYLITGEKNDCWVNDSKIINCKDLLEAAKMITGN